MESVIIIIIIIIIITTTIIIICSWYYATIACLLLVTSSWLARFFPFLIATYSLCTCLFLDAQVQTENSLRVYSEWAIVLGLSRWILLGDCYQ